MPLTISDAAKLEKNKLFSDGVWITLLEADFTPWGFDIIRICRNTEDITWPDNTAGYTWVAFPFELDIKQESSKGEIPRLIIRVSNVNRFIQSYVEKADGAVGAKVTLRLVHSKHLDNPVPEFEEVYEVTATECTVDWVTFTLGAPNPFLLQFPQAKYLKNFCRWRFKSPECLLPNNYVLMDDGSVEMICDVEKYDAVVSRYGVGYVKEVIPKQYFGEIVSIKSYYLPYQLKVTSDHPVLAIKNKDLFCPKYPAKKRRKIHIFVDGYSRCKFCSAEPPEANFIKAGELAEDDFIGVSFNKEIKDLEYFDLEKIMRKVRQPYIIKGDKICAYRKFQNNFIYFNKLLPISNDLLSFIGYFLAEGSFSSNAINFAFHKKEIEYVNDVLRIGKQVFGLDGSVYEKKENCVTVNFFSKLLACFMYYVCGRLALRKKICKELMFLPPEKQKYLLAGLFRGDGFMKTRTKSDGYYGVGLNTASRDLAWQVWMILLRNGVIPYFKNAHSKNSYVHTIVVNGKDGDGLSKLFFNKSVKYREYTFKEAFIKDNILFFKIRNVEREFYKGDVYDLQVIGSDHTFIANGMIVHNCGYQGSDTTCNHTLDDCKAKGNAQRFGAFVGCLPGGIWK